MFGFIKLRGATLRTAAVLLAVAVLGVSLQVYALNSSEEGDAIGTSWEEGHANPNDYLDALGDTILSNCCFAHLVEDIARAQDGQTVKLGANLNNLTLQDDIYISGNRITIDGDGRMLQAVGHRIIVTDGARVTLRGLKLRGSLDESAVVVEQGSELLVEDCEIYYFGGDQGAVVSLGASMTVRGSQIRDNNTAGVAVLEPEPVIVATAGYWGEDTGVTITVDNTRITGNTGKGDVNKNGGGGIVLSGPYTLWVGGRSVISNNSAGAGGGIGVAGGQLIVQETTISKNSAGIGGGIFVRDSIGDGLILWEANLLENRAGGTGGGVYADGQPVFIIGGTIASNFAPGGGGIYTTTLELLHVGETTVFEKNTANYSRSWSLGNPPSDLKQAAGIHGTNILTQSFTSPFDNAYNNCDIYIRQGEGSVDLYGVSLSYFLVEDELETHLKDHSFQAPAGTSVRDLLAAELGDDWLDLYRPTDGYAGGTLSGELPQLLEDHLELQVRYLREPGPPPVDDVSLTLAYYAQDGEIRVLLGHEVITAPAGTPLAALLQLELGEGWHNRYKPESGYRDGALSAPLPEALDDDLSLDIVYASEPPIIPDPDPDPKPEPPPGPGPEPPATTSGGGSSGGTNIPDAAGIEAVFDPEVEEEELEEEVLEQNYDSRSSDSSGGTSVRDAFSSTMSSQEDADTDDEEPELPMVSTLAITVEPTTRYGELYTPVLTPWRGTAIDIPEAVDAPQEQEPQPSHTTASRAVQAGALGGTGCCLLYSCRKLFGLLR